MLEWKKNFRDFDIDANLKYLVEGEPKQYVVKCTDGCGGVLKCGWPTAKQLEVCDKKHLLSPPVQFAQWAHMRRFLSVCTLESGLDQKWRK